MNGFVGSRLGRTFCCLAVGVAMAALAGLARAKTPRADEGLVAHWTFDGSLEDQGGLVADELTPWADGGKAAHARFVTPQEVPLTAGKALALGVAPGDAEYLTAPHSEDVKLGSSYTIEMWIHPTRVGGWNRLFLKWGGPGNYSYHAAMNNGVMSLAHCQAGGEYLFAEGGAITAGRWHHVAAVARTDATSGKGRLSVYVNGRLAGSTPFDGTIFAADNEGVGIGDSASIPSRGTRFRGFIDEVAVWNRAISPDEIRAHYDTKGQALRKFEIAERAGVFAKIEPFGVEEIVFAQRNYGRDPSGHYYANFGYSCIDPEYWLHGADGGRLSKLNVRTGEIFVLVDDPEGGVRDPRVHYDAGKILFSYRKGGTHRYHLYEINVDGTGLRQLTDGPYDDVEPAYLPDGGIVFCSTRSHRWIGCWLAESATLYRCDGDGSNLRMLSSGSFTENTPAVLHDGRILYTRWEYVNRDPVSFHHLWTMNPDGSGQMVFFGNQRPGGVFIDAKPIPGSEKIVLVNIPGHGRNEHVGPIALISPEYGPNVPGALRNISRTSDLRDPYPLSEGLFLAARGNTILLMDAAGKTSVLHSGSTLPVHEPVPVVRRPREMNVFPRADLTQAEATVVMNDVYSGRKMGGLARGTITKLLVMEDLPKPANFHGGGSQPIGHGVTSTLKRILGTVPVESDGSAHFKAPPLRSLYFIALDENDRAVKQMRSFVTFQPGETAGCVGCHEPRTRTPGRDGSAMPLAVLRTASRIEPFPDVPDVLDFPRDVQPIFDRHCVECHNHEKRAGNIALTADRGPVFSLSYYSLYLNWQIKDTTGQPHHGTGRQPGGDDPYTTYSSASPLMKTIEPSHHGVKLSGHEKRMVRLWIDAGATYPGTYAAYGSGQVGGCWGNNVPIREMANDWPSTAPAVEAMTRRCGGCHPPSQMPYHVTALVATDHGDMLSWTRPLSRYSRHYIYNLSRPDKSLVLLSPLSHTAGGYADGTVVTGSTPKTPVAENRRQRPGAIEHPIVFADTADPDYRTILAHVEAAHAKLDEIKRFDMPGFKPNEHYVREMKRRGVLPAAFDLETDPIDVYKIDHAFWQSFWYAPK